MIKSFKTDNYLIEFERVNIDQLINIPILENNRVLGRAILTINLETVDNRVVEVVVLTDIIVYDHKDRGKGVADRLMGFITHCEYFDIIITGINTEKGRALCLKWGFKQEIVGKEKFLVWRKDDKK